MSKSGGMLNSNFSSISESSENYDQPELGYIHGDNDSEMMSPSLDTETNLAHIKMKIQNIGPETNAHLKEIEESEQSKSIQQKSEEEQVLDLESSSGNKFEIEMVQHKVEDNGYKM